MSTAHEPAAKLQLTNRIAADATGTRELIHDLVVRYLRDEAQLEVVSIDYDAPLAREGVDSLGAASIAGELMRSTRKNLNPEVIYELETINELADYLDRLSPTLTEAEAQQAAAPCQAASAEQPCGKPANPLAHYARLNRRVNGLKERGLYFFEPVIEAHDGSWVTIGGKRMLVLGSYEYLGLLGHAHLKNAAIEATQRFGTGHHGVRLLAGTTVVHRQLEAKLAQMMQAEDAIVYSSGYVTNLSTISALVGPGQCVIGDQWNHASIMDGCRMSGANFWEFPHNSMAALERLLEQARGMHTLVVVDSVFSMDGDIIDLPTVVELCKRHGALLMVDEAHSLGVLGATGRGVQEHFNLPADAIDIKMGTLSKTLAGIGGFVAAREEITTFLRHHARGYIFSGALPAPQAAVSLAALEVLEREPLLVRRLQANAAYYLAGLQDLGFDTAKSCTPIVPVMTKTDEITLEMTRLCRAEGLLVIPVSYPAVPMDAPRLRTCVSAIHSHADLDFALNILARAGRRTGLI